MHGHNGIDAFTTEWTSTAVPSSFNAVTSSGSTHSKTCRQAVHEFWVSATYGLDISCTS